MLALLVVAILIDGVLDDNCRQVAKITMQMKDIFLYFSLSVKDSKLYISSNGKTLISLNKLKREDSDAPMCIPTIVMFKNLQLVYVRIERSFIPSLKAIL